MSDAAKVAAGAAAPVEAAPECGRYELLFDHEDGGIQYRAGDVLEFTCEEAAFLKEHGRIWATTTKPITRKRLQMSACAGCGAHLVNDGEPAAA